MEAMSAVNVENKKEAVIESDKPGYFVISDKKHELPKEYRDFLTISGKLILLPVVVIVGVFTGVHAGFCKAIETIHSLINHK